MKKKKQAPPKGEKQRHYFNDLKRTVIDSVYSREVVKAKYNIVEIERPEIKAGDFQLLTMAKLGEEVANG